MSTVINDQAAQKSPLKRIVIDGLLIVGAAFATAGAFLGGLLLAVEIDVYDQNREWERIGASLLQEECGDVLPDDVNPVAGEEFVLGVTELPAAIERHGEELIVVAGDKKVCSTGDISSLVTFD